MPGCAAVGCNNRSEKGYTMKCFPRDPSLRDIWKQRVGRADWRPSNNSFLCHVHFEPNQWVVTPSGKIKLIKGALPSIFTETSTRKSQKKRQRLGDLGDEVVSEGDDDLDEYEVEYLDNDGPFIFNMSNQKIVPNIINSETQNTTQVSGNILQNVNLASGDTLKDLQNQNIIIVADENNREIGKLINVSSSLVSASEKPNDKESDRATKEKESESSKEKKSERGKENVRIVPKPDKPASTSVKVEVKEETSASEQNGSSAPDYDEIERKLKEICHSENEADGSTSNTNSPEKANGQSLPAPTTFSLEDLENDSDNAASEDSNEEVDSDAATVRPGTKRKREDKSESSNRGNSSVSISYSSETDETREYDEDLTDIINDLETKNPVESSLPRSKCMKPVVLISCETSNASKPVVKNDVRLKFKNGTTANKSEKCGITTTSKHNSTEELVAKLNIQGEAIEKLSSQLIMYKDMERQMKSLTEELRSKDKQIAALMGGSTAKPQARRKNSAVDLKNTSEADLRGRIESLEARNKNLMKTVALEVQNRRKSQCQLKSRDNRIKELNWKLEKASKFLERAEKNAKNYKRKMLSMQALVRRKKLLNERSSQFDEFLVCQSSQSFTDNTLGIALEIVRVCGIEGYLKLSSYEFPLPSLKELSKRYPADVDYYELDEEEEQHQQQQQQQQVVDDGIAGEVLGVSVKMENVEYLDSEFLSSELDDTATGTVQDIFDESSDSEDLDLDELRKHIAIELDDCG